jgi:RNA polymerase sigma factor (sigma-70 family)
MASRPHEGPASAEDGRLSVETAHYYARIYGPARAGCLGELRRAGCSEEEAEDIFAATFERIMRKRDPAREGFGPAQTVALLKKACRQKLIDERRHRGVLQIVPLGDASNRPDRTSEDPAEAAAEREAASIAREAISSLPERDRALFFQRHQLGLSPEEIMRRNPGLSRRTYRKIIQRANARALEAFEEIGSGARCAEMRREQLRRYVAEEAREEEIRLIGAHLRRCRGCRLEVARLRGHLHELATGLAALLTLGHARGGLLGDVPARLLDAAGRGGEALAGATQAARERLRELVLRAALSSSSGGESAAGQLTGIAGTKVASVCVTGAITASCLAAGVVPGVGGLGLAGSQQGHRGSSESTGRTEPAMSRSLSSQLKTPAIAGAGASEPRSEKAAASDEGRSTHQDRKKRRYSPEAKADYSSRPTISGRQVGTELGAEATGTARPVPSLGASGEAGTSTGQGEVSPSRGSDGSRDGGLAAAAEFGL